MKRYIVPSVAALCLMAGCKESTIPGFTPKEGEEVVFGIRTNDTRTIYGEYNDQTKSYPISWLAGDQVYVMSPQANVKEGQYQINLGDAESAAAGTLDKISAAGVQWGSNPTGDFYSVYPYSRVQMTNSTTNPTNRTVVMRMPHMQNDYIGNESGTYKAYPDMSAAMMYANTQDVANGQPVTLLYTPFATALRFTLQGPSTIVGGSITGDAVQIQNIRITAPANQQIAGNFTLTFPDGTEAPTVKLNSTTDNVNYYNYVEIFSSYEGSEGGGYLTLKQNESIELNAFLMLDKATELGSGWSITVNCVGGKSFTKSLASSKTATLQPGQIHNLGLMPPLKIPGTISEWDTSNWMVNIPRNTYLSEISLPGSWNSLNKDFQYNQNGVSSSSAFDSNATAVLQAQYNAGCRAFHLDTRWQATTNWAGGAVDFKELGIANGGSNTNTVAQGSIGTTSGTVKSDGNDGGRVMTADNNPSFASALSTITAESKDDEYMIVFVSFAQDSKTRKSITWQQAVSNACAQNSKVIMATSLNQNSVVGEVLGKVIVVICDTDDPVSIANSPCFAFKSPMTLTQVMFDQDYLTSPLQYAVNTNSSGISMLYSQVQITSSGSAGFSGDRGYAPTLDQRTDQLNNILNYSLTNYGKTDYAHNNWLYMGLGGYAQSSSSSSSSSKSYDKITETYTPWIYNKVMNMSAVPTSSQTKYYPVGIVLMNFVTGTSSLATGVDGQAVTGQSAVKQILLLNSKYQKAYNPDWWDQTGGGTTPAKSPADYSSSHTNGGNAWTVN